MPPLSMEVPWGPSGGCGSGRGRGPRGSRLAPCVVHGKSIGVFVVGMGSVSAYFIIFFDPCIVTFNGSAMPGYDGPRDAPRRGEHFH